MFFVISGADEMKFQVIIADPPWQFNDKLKMSATKRGAESNYSILSLERLCELDIKSIIDDNAFCCIWVPNVLIEDGLKVLKAWNFEYKGLYGWGKVSSRSGKVHFGMGHYFRSSFEIALFGKRGKIQVDNKSQRNIEVDNFDIDDPQKHSKKTEKLQDSLDLMFPNANKLELFARRKRENWECVGLECNEEDVFDSIKRLKQK